MRILGLLAALVGVLFLVVAIMYFTIPAHSLPHFFPGFDPSDAKTHIKHGIGAVGLSLACFAFAWFQTGKKSSK